ncbi:juvenile hormone epoxide hydrolase-like [Manduca sexta]|uniref:juvenile hormone epoxide hydrolase-like n=1 Tax=Manduca sexta TaxID=7130 RepID=UPI00188EB71D|nr:juvenile hormone epoxide hydrolase-like [Manduca sexta]
MYSWLVLGLVAAAAAAGYDYESDPDIYHDKWWGPEGMEEDTSIRPFKVEWKKKMVEDLLYRLKNRRRLTPSLKGTNYNYGLNTDTMSYWLDYWANNYNFTAREEYLNQYPQFMTDIQGLSIHFIRIVPEIPEGKYSIPLLMLHGYPGSVREYYDVLWDLTKPADNRDFVIEVVVPSLPGYGYSDATNLVGLGFAEMAFIFKNLMNRLGHEKFYVQGGDWGALIGANMATFFPEIILGYHTTMPVAATDEALTLITAGSLYPAAVVPTELTNRLYPLQNTLEYFAQDFGYLHIQAAKSDALGVCIGESPTSLLGWFLHLFSIFSRRTNGNDPMGGLEIYSRDQIIDNLMIYWDTETATTSIRLYAESFNKKTFRSGFLNAPTTVPTVAVQALGEIFYFPPAALNTKFTNLVAVDVLDDYGHFLAMEQPQLFVELVLSGLQRIMQFNKQNMDGQSESNCSTSA